MRILLVEDDAVSRRILQQVLRAVGHTVTACPDAETAWDAQMAQHHDVIVLDWMLPGMDGIEFCQRLRQEEGEDRTLVLFTTARDTAEDLDRVLAAGADDYIAKPIDPEVLGIRLRVAEARVKTLRERAAAETAKRELEERLQQVQKLESLATLAGGIAHDFNNMLLAIQGSNELARRRVPDDSDAHPHLERIAASCKRAAELTGELLAYSGRGRFLTLPLDLAEFVHTLDPAIRDQLGPGARLLHRDGAQAMVDANPEQMRYLLHAILSNAAESLGSEGGEIAVRTGEMTADADDLAGLFAGAGLRPGSYSWVEVSDTGVGMDDDARRRIFDPFYSTKSAGRGMGMASALGIVRGHGGAIDVRSTPGAGTTVRILVPCSDRDDVPESGTVTVTLPVSLGTPVTVLVVDDEEAIREVAQATLEDAGLVALTASGGVEALQILAEQPGEVQLVLLDLMMPGMDGLETLERLHQSYPDLPVVLSSGYSERDITPREGGARPAGFLKKPYSPDALIAIVRKRLGA